MIARAFAESFEGLGPRGRKAALFALVLESIPGARDPLGLAREALAWIEAEGGAGPMAAKPHKVARVPAGEGAAADAPSPEAPAQRPRAGGGRRKGIEALADRALALLAEAGRPLAPRELAAALDLEPRSWRLRHAVEGLVKSGLVAVVGRGRSTAYDLTEREGYVQTAPAGEQPSLSEAPAGAEGAAAPFADGGGEAKASCGLQDRDVPPAVSPPPPQEQPQGAPAEGAPGAPSCSAGSAGGGVVRKARSRPADVPAGAAPPPHPLLRDRQRRADQALIDAHLADKGATRCPTAYLAPVEGAERVAEPVPHYEQTAVWASTNQARKERAARRAGLNRDRKAAALPAAD